ncbi:MAG TPA: acetyltransferase [Candidatus Paceibacterota bacterium]
MSSLGIIIYGASGHGKVVADALIRSGRAVAGFLDDNAVLHGKKFFGYSVFGGREKLAELFRENCRGIIIAIGKNTVRQELAGLLTAQGFEFAIATHPSAVIAQSAAIGAGTVVAACAVINPDARVGEHCIINTAAVVEHDNVIGAFVHIAPGVNLGGRVTVGDGTDIFTNATVIPDITIGKNCVVGAGAVVLKDVPDGVTVVGNPARVLEKK